MSNYTHRVEAVFPTTLVYDMEFDQPVSLAEVAEEFLARLKDSSTAPHPAYRGLIRVSKTEGTETTSISIRTITNSR